MRSSATVKKILVLVAIGTGCATGGDSETKAQRCERLREHLIDVRFGDAPAEGASSRREAMKRAMGNDFIDRCLQLEDEQLSCTLAAKDHKAVAGCAPMTGNS